MYITRSLDLSSILKEKSCFLFGARQSGKSSYTTQQLALPVLKTYDLLDHRVFFELTNNPSRMREELEVFDNKNGALIVIDEIQKCPALLDEVHLLIERYHMRFLLTGSSARKLKRSGVNLLAGRARSRNFHPLTYKELSDAGIAFDLGHAMQFGLLPVHALQPMPKDDLFSYVSLYLKEEVAAEGLVRNIPSFSRFLQVAAVCNGQILNYSSIGSDAQVNRHTVQNYFEILKDTLLGYELESFQNSVKRKAIEANKFYFFDMGVTNTLRKLGPISQDSSEFGVFFEHFIFLELKAFLDYMHPTCDLHYWRSKSNFEVDFILDGKIAIEVKAAHRITEKHLKGLVAFGEEQVVESYICVCQETTKRMVNGILIYPWQEFLTDLWGGKIF
ncbi:MAG: AAA family ATPase [Bdellovibrionota bacterium]